MPDWLWMRRHRDTQRHGPDELRVADAPTRREAAALETIRIRPLDRGERDRFRERWSTEVRGDLLVNPAAAVDHADALIQDVLRARGFPVGDYRRSGALSLDQTEILRYFQAAHQIAAANARRAAQSDVIAHRYFMTDDLRHAVQQFRRLFDELVETAGEETLAG
jgi:hypothetical protein